jgi:hypothetical protein
MSSDESIQRHESQGDLKPLEAALGSLIPAASRVDRDRLMYLAGAASVDAKSAFIANSNSPGTAADDSSRFGLTWWRRLSGAFWPLAAAALLLISLGLGAALALREPRERVVYVERQPTQESQSFPTLASSAVRPVENSSDRAIASASPDARYLFLRAQVLRRGVAALDSASQSDSRPVRRDERNRVLLNELLGG